MTDSASRIEDMVDLLAKLASGELGARGSRSELDDDLDAVIEGVNMLAEELEASRSELEERVRARTAELESVNTDMLLLAELGNLLAACETADEAYSMVSHHLEVMFEGLSGAVYLYGASHNILEPLVTWGEFAGGGPLDSRGCWALRRGHDHFVDLHVPSMSCQHVTTRTGDSVCIPMSALGENVGMLHLMGHASTTGMKMLSPTKRQLAVPVAEQISLALANIDLREMLRVQALRDPLTGLHNRRFADEWIHQEAARSDRHGHSLGLIMVDVDKFKDVNDRYGHEAGDVVLTAVGDLFRTSLRPDDVACRYGGEEFLVMLADIDKATVHERAEVLRRRVAALRVEHRNAMLPPVTISAGIALYPEHGSSAAAVIQAADKALYAAKRAGRNQTVMANDPIVQDAS